MSTAFKRRTLEANRRQHRFNAASVARLEQVYRTNPIPSRETREALARDLGVSERQVQVWLQNKRQRSKARMMREAAEHGGGLVREPFALSSLPRPSIDVTEACLRDDLQMEVFCDSKAPFRVLWASNDWLSFCGFKQSELKGQTMRILSGPATDVAGAEELNVAGKERRCASASLINYTKNRIPFRHTVRIEPLVNTYGQIRMLKAVSSDIDVLVPPEAQDERGLFNDALPPLIYA